MIEVKILDTWRAMDIEQARRMARFYVDQEGETFADSHIHGATVFELLKEQE